MKTLFDIVSRETFIAFITECYNAVKKMDETIENRQVRSDLISSCYYFLKNYNVRTDECAMFNDILTDEDTSVLKEVNPYNYNKLIIAKKSSSL